MPSPGMRAGIRLGPEGMSARRISGVDLGRDAASQRVGALHHGAVRYAGALALVALLYYGAGRVGLELAYLDGAVAALWPPAGLGLAVLFLYGIRLWPGIAIGDLLLADFSTPTGTVLAQTFGNTVALVVAALLLRRLTRGRGSLERVSDVLALVACAVVAALVSAAFGPLSLRLGDVIAPDELGRVFRTWTLGDAAGVLVVAPAILTWASAGLNGFGRRELAEGVVVLTLLVLLATLPPQRDVPYIVFPVLLWAAIRFGPRGAATAILVVCSITVWNTAQNEGPFVRDSITDSLLTTQLFIAVSALTSLLLAAVTAERRQATMALTASEAAQRALADEQAALRRVATLVAGAPPPSRVFEQVTKEVALLLDLPGASLVRYEGPGTATVVGGWSDDGRLRLPVSSTIDLSGDTVMARVLRSGSPQRVAYTDAGGLVAEKLQSAGYRAAVAAPVNVEGRLWGALAVGTRSADPLPDGVERRLCDFAELVAQAIANAEAHEELAASRARIVNGRRRGAPAPRAQPARRRAAATRVGRAGSSPRGREAREGSAGRPRAPRRSAGPARPGTRRASRARPRNPSCGAHRPRPGSGDRVAGDAFAGAGRDQGAAGRAPRDLRRGGGLLRRRRGDDERGQVRTRLARDRQRAPLERARDGHGLRRRRRRRGPCAGHGPARAGRSSGGAQRTPRCRELSGGRHPHQRRDPLLLTPSGAFAAGLALGGMRSSLSCARIGGAAMNFEVGERVVVEAESTDRRPQAGTVREVVRERPARYRIEWDDGHESIYAPAAGALQPERRAAESASRLG